MINLVKKKICSGFWKHLNFDNFRKYPDFLANYTRPKTSLNEIDSKLSKWRLYTFK